ncbi:MAG: PIN domain-containing protein [Acidimicrobiia bacterium]|nr:PIN domain-containing protein [Actinomycetota bacterium]MBL6924228.1 PIN domain-containing protein [Acidimicrobiia bacterium]MBL6926856.1 PIN domain-containing protein [Acidimicrobiia bacterium]
MGLTVLDAGVVIGWMDDTDAHHAAVKAILADSRSRGDHLVLPASALGEAMVGPARRGSDSVETALSLLGSVPVKTVPVDELVAVETAALRASMGTRLRLPDAMVVATAIVLDADRLVTTDRRWPFAATLGFEGELVVV